MSEFEPTQYEDIRSSDFYSALLNSRGLRYTLKHFLNSHLFDIVHGTDTHMIVPKDDYLTRPSNFSHGTYYQSSWTSEIARNFKACLELLGDRFADYRFIDIGCGKGKVVLFWKLLGQRKGLRQSVLGIDYYKPLIDIARLNQAIMFRENGAFVYGDVLEFDFRNYGDKLIVNLFNPFGVDILNDLLKSLQGVDHIIVYNYPVYKDLLLHRGYRIVYSHVGYFDIEKSMIFAKV